MTCSGLLVTWHWSGFRSPSLLQTFFTFAVRRPDSLKPQIEGTNHQTRHNFVGEIRISSVKICINPYPSLMHRCIAKTFHVIYTTTMQFAKQIATLCNKNQQPAAKMVLPANVNRKSISSKSEPYVTWRDIRIMPLIH